MYTCTVEPWLSGPWLSRFLDYLDFFLWSQFGCEYLLVTIKIRSYILFRLQHWKVQSNARFFFYFQTAKAVLACIVTNEEHSNEFWLAQSCIVAKWNFTLFYIGSPSVVSKTNKLASWTFIHHHNVFEAQAIHFFDKRSKVYNCAIRERRKKESICQLVSSRSLISARTRKWASSLPKSQRPAKDWSKNC